MVLRGKLRSNKIFFGSIKFFCRRTTKENIGDRILEGLTNMLEPQVADPNGQFIEMGLKLVKGNFKISIDDFAAHTELIQVNIYDHSNNFHIVMIFKNYFNYLF
jgi:hypothetical protein